MLPKLETHPFQKTVFIFNPKSGYIGNKKGVIRWIDRIWGSADRDYCILVTTRAGEAVHLARKEAERGAGLIIAIGGDGTLNEVVRGTIGTDACVGLIPAGSGNGFARHWNIPLDPQNACRGMLSPRIVHCDIGTANQHIFLVTFGCGMDAVISARYAHSTIRGIPSYFYHGVSTFFEYHAPHIQVQQNGRLLYEGRPLLLTVANAQGYGGGTIIAPEAKADDGLLDFCVFDSLSIFSSLKYLPNLFNGKVYKIPGYRHQQISRATVILSENSPVHLDGDYCQDQREIEIRVQPRALRFALPSLDRSVP